jgi:hypothetical protein
VASESVYLTTLYGAQIFTAPREEIVLKHDWVRNRPWLISKCFLGVSSGYMKGEKNNARN